MLRTNTITFDEWFELFKAKVVAFGHYGTLDQRLFWEDYENEITPAAAAKKFIRGLE